MSWVSKIIGDSAKSPISAIFDGIDSLVTNDEERAAAQLLKIRAMQEPGKLQVELNKIEASHRSIFVAGWRPAIGWVCALGLSFPFLLNPIFQWYTGEAGPDLPIESLLELVVAMLGMGALRTIEKLQGRAK